MYNFLYVTFSVICHSLSLYTQQGPLLWLGSPSPAACDWLSFGIGGYTCIFTTQKKNIEKYSSWGRMVGSRREATIRG